MGRIQAIKGFAMHIKGFALYFNSNRKTLKSFKQLSRLNHILILERSHLLLCGQWMGLLQAGMPGGHLGSFGSHQMVVAGTEEVTVEVAG